MPDAEPRSCRLRTRPRLRRRGVADGRVGVHCLLARASTWRTGRAQRRATAGRRGAGHAPGLRTDEGERGMTDQPLFIALGAHVLDVHAKYVEAIPEGQGGALIEQIRLSPAGAAGGAAVTMAERCAPPRSVGAVRTDDLGGGVVAKVRRL